jgi:hypothetical protein
MSLAVTLAFGGRSSLMLLAVQFNLAAWRGFGSSSILMGMEGGSSYARCRVTSLGRTVGWPPIAGLPTKPALERSLEHAHIGSKLLAHRQINHRALIRQYVKNPL